MLDSVGPVQIKAAKNGAETELAAIVARFMPTINRAARRAKSPGLDFEDAVQEGIIGLFAAIESFAEGKGAAFASYATICINNAVIGAKRAALRKKHGPLNYSVPISHCQSVPGPEEATIANEEVRVTLKKAAKVLSKMEKTVLWLRIDGWQNRQIAKKMGISAKTVENALARVRQKLR